MQTALQLFKRLSAEIPNEEEEFPKIREQYQTLGKQQMLQEYQALLLSSKSEASSWQYLLTNRCEIAQEKNA